MREHPWNLGICGTFDVANYGDLLFPLIAEHELAERLGPLTLHRFAYHERWPPAWPYRVRSVADLPACIDRLEAMIVGGGMVVRFDKEVAPNYAPPLPSIHHPTGYWLTPALLALQHDIPVIWNTPGVHNDGVPAWARPLVEPAVALSRYVAGRDESSAAVLQEFSSAVVPVVPDSAFGIGRLIAFHDQPSDAFAQLSAAVGLTKPYIVVQATYDSQRFVRFVKTHAHRLKDFQLVIVPIGPSLNDSVRVVDDDFSGSVRLHEWPHPLVLGELIGRAEAVVGRSLHLFITALAAGVPIFTTIDASGGRYAALERFTRIVPCPDENAACDALLTHLGHRSLEPAIGMINSALRTHWDRVAAAIETQGQKTSTAVNRLWQSMPAVLEALTHAKAVDEEANESAAIQAVDAVTPTRTAASDDHERIVSLEQRLQEVSRLLEAARLETAERDRRLNEIVSSTSWRVTTPLRAVGHQLARRSLRPARRRAVIDFDHLRRQKLETTPFKWAAITNLFRPGEAEYLAATYPHDHFKLLADYAGEKDYEYEARGFISMGSHAVVHGSHLSEPWQALAIDLLSDEYRASMSRLTGLDLSNAIMEANIFHYGAGASLGAHRDLPEKLVTHVLYFNRRWNVTDGGCLAILSSQNPQDTVTEIPPLAGNAAVIVRSDNSWHEVRRVVSGTRESRRSVTVTFYRDGAISTMWPPGDTTPLHDYGNPSPSG